MTMNGGVVEGVRYGVDNSGTLTIDNGSILATGVGGVEAAGVRNGENATIHLSGKPVVGNGSGNTDVISFELKSPITLTGKLTGTYSVFLDGEIAVAKSDGTYSIREDDAAKFEDYTLEHNKGSLSGEGVGATVVFSN